MSLYWLTYISYSIQLVYFVDSVNLFMLKFDLERIIAVTVSIVFGNLIWFWIAENGNHVQPQFFAQIFCIFADKY